MLVKLEIPDSVWRDDPKGYHQFFEALQFMVNRMAMSHFKYQANSVPPTMEEAVRPIDELLSLHQRVAMYDSRYSAVGVIVTVEELHKDLDTGNTENLLDAANICVIEHLFPKHGKAHFRAQTSKESPGLAYLP